MAIWLPRKAKPHELKGGRQKPQREKQLFRRQCKICGKYFDGEDKICPSCNRFIAIQKERERGVKRQNEI